MGKVGGVSKAQLVGVTAVAFGLIGWFLAGLHWELAIAELRRASWGWVLASACFLLFEYVIRAFRWYLLVLDCDPKVRLSDLWAAIVIGVAFNSVLPLRGGDVVRLVVLSKRRALPFTTVLSTTVAEKLVDGVGMVLTLMVILWLLPDTLGDALFVAEMKRVGLWAGLGSLVMFCGVIVLGTRQAQGFVRAGLKPLPRRLQLLGDRLFTQLMVGLASVGNPLRLLPALGLTGALWLNGYLGILCLFWAFGLNLPDAAALFAEFAVHVAVAVPQAPGFVGVFQVTIEKTMAFWGAGVGASEALALVMWLAFYAPVTLIGLVTTALQGEPIDLESAEGLSGRVEAP